MEWCGIVSPDHFAPARLGASAGRRNAAAKPAASPADLRTTRHPRLMSDMLPRRDQLTQAYAETQRPASAGGRVDRRRGLPCSHGMRSQAPSLREPEFRQTCASPCRRGQSTRDRGDGDRSSHLQSRVPTARVVSERQWPSVLRGHADSRPARANRTGEGRNPQRCGCPRRATGYRGHPLCRSSLAPSQRRRGSRSALRELRSFAGLPGDYILSASFAPPGRSSPRRFGPTIAKSRAA